MWRILRPDAAAVLNDKMARRSLVRYFAVMQDEKPAKFMIAKKLPAKFSEEGLIEELWLEHTRLAQKFYEIEKEIDTREKRLQEMPTPEKSYLDLKIEIAKRILTNCHFCTRGCGVNRVEGELGYCRCGTEIAVSSIFEHMGEEPELVPSGTIFTIGCTMRCKHCQNWTISQHVEKGEVYTPEGLAKEIERLRLNGCRNANLVGGEPTPWLQQWLETFKHVNVNIPVVWNSNSYYSPETAQLLAGFADVYLLDFKYGPSKCAERISDAPNYWEACTRNHLEAKKYGELIIRILILPSHLECCTRHITNWIAENLGTETRVNVMFQYRPEWRAHEIPELRRRLTRDEMERAIQLAEEANLANFLT
ncbi:MAG: radical SAM protein [Candidatus Bathyarchaeota archaeon]|nr:radical SAM protein [Candidatus Bathyarchaeota archaeon]MDH5746494.1 radical SAM protein [Candidatus Bathyarchaeota archaeon]